jgi:hypothetical protein
MKVCNGPGECGLAVGYARGRMSTDRCPRGVSNGRRRLGALGILAALATSCAPAAPLAPVSAGPAAPAAPTAAAPVIDVAGEWELRWDRTFVGWQPPLFEGKLSLQRAGEQWTGQLRFRQSVAQLAVASVRLDGDRIDVVFHGAPGKDGKGPDEVELSGWIREGRLIGEIRWGKEIGWTPFGGRRVVKLRLQPGAVDHSLPAADLSKTDADAVRILAENATAERSSPRGTTSASTTPPSAARAGSWARRSRATTTTARPSRRPWGRRRSGRSRGRSPRGITSPSTAW